MIPPEIIEQILVKVNGEILTKTELETRQVQALRQKGQSIDLASDKGNTELRKALSKMVLEVKAEIRFRPTEDGKLVPETETDVKVRGTGKS